MVLVLLQDGEHTGRRVLARLARTDRRHADGDAVAVHVGALFVQADHQHYGALGRDLRIPQEFARLQRADDGLRHGGLRVGGEGGGTGEQAGQQQEERQGAIHGDELIAVGQPGRPRQITPWA
ncbi:hypothetical protein D9M69_681250 [compost metagenome]